MDETTNFGVFPHAEWIVNAVQETGRGFVVRPLKCGVPYSRMVPLFVAKRERTAQKCADAENAKR
jgi:hypothetical protein